MYQRADNKGNKNANGQRTCFNGSLCKMLGEKQRIKFKSFLDPSVILSLIFLPRQVNR